jgi:hypothetical protein
MTDLHALDISREYFADHALQDLRERFPGLWPRLSAGLVGNGSDCFRFDDAISRDHDWGVDLYIWVTEDDRNTIPALRAWRTDLLQRIPPNYPRTFSKYTNEERVFVVSDFYRMLIGTPGRPEALKEWLRIPEHLLAFATNGEVFWEGPCAGSFSEIRCRLLDYYPQDLVKKKLAACLMSIAQTGQYNLARCAARGDKVAYQITQGLFLDNVCRAVLILNRVFAPSRRSTTPACTANLLHTSYY